MAGEEKKYIRTWEELMMDRIAQAFRAKDQENAELFDNILEETEMLLKLVPSMHKELEAIKEHKQTLIKTGAERAAEKANVCPDDITKEFVYRKEIYSLQWDYRTDMLEAILTIMGSYQKIPFAQPVKTEISAVRPAKIEEVKTETKPKPEIEGQQIKKTPTFKTAEPVE